MINEDKVTPGGGFGTHGHRDMEIVTYVLDGALEHKDSLGTGSVIKPGDVQRMSAGTGIRHSEFNASDRDPVHFLQIWIVPDREGLDPSYEQISVAPEAKQGQLRLIGSRDGREGSVTIHQDVSLYTTTLAEGDAVEHALAAGRVAWVQVARGAVDLNGHTLTVGDGAAVSALDRLALTGAFSGDTPGAEVLLFDMAI